MPAIDLFGSFFFFFLYSNTFSLSWLLSIYRWNIEPLSAGTPTVQHKKHTHTHTNTRAVACQTLHWRRIVFHLSLPCMSFLFVCVIPVKVKLHYKALSSYSPHVCNDFNIKTVFFFSPPPYCITTVCCATQWDYISRHGDLIPFHHVL